MVYMCTNVGFHVCVLIVVGKDFIENNFNFNLPKLLTLNMLTLISADNILKYFFILDWNKELTIYSTVKCFSTGT